MDNLSFHLTDITANSVRAGATCIDLRIEIEADRIRLSVKDNGRGMNAEAIQRAIDPFYTTRTTRKVGLGLPFLKQNAEQTGGHLSIRSTPGEGTLVTACFVASHIDCPPWGDLAGTVAMLITGNPELNLRFTYRKAPLPPFSLTTADLKEALDGMPVSHPQVTTWLKELLKANLHS